jgi:hypothetical protein
MTPSTDYSALQVVQSFRFPVYASAGLQLKANEVATRCERAYNFLQGIFHREPKIALFVLDPNDWSTYAWIPLYGMPHYCMEQLVVAGQTSVYWQNLVPQDGVAQPEYIRSVRNVYGASDGSINLSPFFDLLALHELGHAFHLDVPSYFPRMWIAELFANLCLHAYVAECEPELLPILETLPRGFPDITPDLVLHQSLKDFEILYGGMEAMNYTWYQGHLHRVAKHLYEGGGVVVLQRLWESFVISDQQLSDILRRDVNPQLADVMETWPNK